MEDLRKTLIDGIERMYDVLEERTTKNVLVQELSDMITNEEFNISKSKLEELRRELLAKTNYCFVLVDAIKNHIQESNQMAENNQQLIMVAEYANYLREELTKLVEGAEFVQSKDVLDILHLDKEVDEGIAPKITVEYE